MNRRERQAAILRLVQDQALSTQAELVQALQDEGHDVVQTTVSRDVAELGLVKVRAPSGRLIYAPPGTGDDLAEHDAGRHAARDFSRVGAPHPIAHHEQAVGGMRLAGLGHPERVGVLVPGTLAAQISGGGGRDAKPRCVQ